MPAEGGALGADAEEGAPGVPPGYLFLMLLARSPRRPLPTL